MKIHTRSLFVLAAAVVLGACSSAPSKAVYQVEAKVVSMERAPEICRDADNRVIRNAAIGGTVGGIVGNQFGSGKGRAAMTILGIVTGVSIGISGESDRKVKLTCTRDGYVGTLQYIHPQTRQMVFEERYFARRTRAEYVNILI